MQIDASRRGVGRRSHALETARRIGTVTVHGGAQSGRLGCIGHAERERTFGERRKNTGDRRGR